jgi:HlyD family secretion protein
VTADFVLKMKKIIFRGVMILLVLGAAWGGYRLFQQLPQRQQQVATTRVRRGDVVIRTYSRGELRAVRSVTLTAPNLFSTVQVTRLAPVGGLAKEKDLIVEFDDSDRRAQLEETLLEVEQIDEQIKKAKADLAIRNNQDQVDLLKTRYAVRRAELEVKRNELLSEIDAKKNILTLEEQRRRLKQLESDIKSRQEQAQAELAVLYEQRNKSMIDVSRERQRIAQAKLLSTMTGLVSIRQNRSGFFMFGQQQPDIREGDTLQPGMPVADVLDLSELEVLAKVGELDRANLHEGQDVFIQLDAVPEKQFNGKIKSMSGTASSNVFSGDPGKKFDVVFSIDMRQLLTELGVKPQDIKRIMDTAERNAKKAPPGPPPSALAAMGGPGSPGGAGGPAGPGGPGGPAQVMQFGPAPPGAPGAMPQGMAGSEGRRGGVRMGGGSMSEQDRQKFQQALQKELGGKNVQDLSPEERQKIFTKLRDSLGLPEGGGRRGGERAANPGSQAPEAGPADLLRPAGAGDAWQASEQERANAKLPLPPEEDSQLEVLLRPGLLADVEIIVEKIPNAIHIPAQAVFDKNGTPIVYIQKARRFEERPIQIAKRSESTMVIAGGLQPGDVVALADPNAKKGDKKAGEKKGGAGIPAVPAGGGGTDSGGRKGGK